MGVASAQEPPLAGPQLTEIVVTGQRREETLIQAAVVVEVFDARLLVTSWRSCLTSRS